MASEIKGVFSLGASLVRPTRGSIAVGHRKLPKKTLVLYEAEYCPYCRYVREALGEVELPFLRPLKSSAICAQPIAPESLRNAPCMTR